MNSSFHWLQSVLFLFHQLIMWLENGRMDQLIHRMKAKGINTNVFYASQIFIVMIISCPSGSSLCTPVIHPSLSCQACMWVFLSCVITTSCFHWVDQSETKKTPNNNNNEKCSFGPFSVAFLMAWLSGELATDHRATVNVQPCSAIFLYYKLYIVATNIAKTWMFSFHRWTSFGPFRH